MGRWLLFPCAKVPSMEICLKEIWLSIAAFPSHLYLILQWDVSLVKGENQVQTSVICAVNKVELTLIPVPAASRASHFFLLHAELASPRALYALHWYWSLSFSVSLMHAHQSWFLPCPSPSRILANRITQRSRFYFHFGRRFQRYSQTNENRHLAGPGGGYFWPKGPPGTPQLCHIPSWRPAGPGRSCHSWGARKSETGSDNLALGVPTENCIKEKKKLRGGYTSFEKIFFPGPLSLHSPSHFFAQTIEIYSSHLPMLFPFPPFSDEREKVCVS